MDLSFANFHLLFFSTSILFTLSAMIFALRREKRRQEQVREIALRLGLDLNDSSFQMATGAPLDLEKLLPGMQEDARTKDVKAEDIERVLQLPVLGAFLRSAIPWAMTGQIARTKVRANPVRENKKQTIHFHAFFETQLPFAISVSSESAAQQLGKKIFSQLRDLQIGDPAFDEKLYIRGEDAAAILAWILDGTHKTVLLDFFATYPNARLDRDGLHCVDRSGRIDFEIFQKTFEGLTSTLRRLA